MPIESAHNQGVPVVGRGGITRRSVATGLAWTVPVIVAAPAAHAYSTSAPTVRLTGVAYKLPGASCENAGYYKQGYRYYMTASNPPGKPACLEITSVSVGGTSQSTFELVTTSNAVSTGCSCATNPSHSILVPANTTVNFTVDVQMTNSANTTLGLTYDIYDATTGGTCHKDFANLSTATAANTPVASDCAPYCANGNPTPNC